MAEIVLTQGKVALVDDEDFSYLNQYKWYAVKAEGRYYARRALPKVGEKQDHILMHQALLKCPKGKETDHVDGNGLNNKRGNIRPCNHHENLMNKKGHGKTSIFKGVSKRKTLRRFRAQIELNGKSIHLGYFDTAIEAAIAYNETAKKLFGEYAKLNEVSYE